MLSLKEYLEKEVYINGKGGIKRKFLDKYMIPSTNAVFLLRKAQVYHRSKNKIKRVLSRIYKTKLERRYGLFISLDIEIGLGLRFPHPNGIIIGGGVEIGSNCTIFQQVTIGSRIPGESKKGLQPKIKNDVMLFAGSKILGDIVALRKVIVMQDFQHKKAGKNILNLAIKRLRRNY